jgi:integrase
VAHAVPGHSIVSYDYALDPKGFCRYTFKPAARRAGFPELKLHELRHTFASLALEFDALTMYELSIAMGHSSYVITANVYSHLGRKDYSASRAKFTARMAANRAEPILLRATDR